MEAEYWERRKNVHMYEKMEFHHHGHIAEFMLRCAVRGTKHNPSRRGCESKDSDILVDM